MFQIKSKFHSRNLVVQAMKASTDEMDTDFGQTLSMEMVILRSAHRVD